MIESIKKVSNPLTVIAIFAGLAEVSGTVVLPFLKEDSQAIYVWFLMIFPAILIGLFFLTLNFNHKVLYAPSDFENEDNFLKLFGKPTAEDRIEKLSSELEFEKEGDTETQDVADKNVDLAYRDIIRRSAASTHYLAEELVITKLAQEFDEIEKEVMLRTGKSQFLFDAIAKKGKKVFAIEVKYIRGIGHTRSLKLIRSSIVKIQKAFNEISESNIKPMVLILAIATDLTGEDLRVFTKEVEEAAITFMHPQEIRIFNLASLERELLGLKTL